MGKLAQIPYENRDAAHNMALDAVMLIHGGERDCAFWRLYGWTEPSVTFGYSQKWMDIQGSLGEFKGSCIRRLTGGGIVDHRNDLTYALSLPASHPFHRIHAQVVYQGIHQVIAGILVAMGFQSILAPCEKSCGESESTHISVCFQAPEPYDVIDRKTRIKQAGAAMKRNRSGLLIQGSLSREMLPGLDQHRFGDSFSGALADWLSLPKGGDMILPQAMVKHHRKKFSSATWNQRH